MKILIGMWIVIAGSMIAAALVYWAGVDPDWLRVYAMFSLPAAFTGTIITLIVWWVRRRERAAVAKYVASTEPRQT